MWQCSQQHENREEAKFCAKCGEKRDTRVYCTECGTLLQPDDLFCTSCGHRRDTELQVVSKPDPAFIAPVAVAPTPVVQAPVAQPIVSQAPATPVIASPQAPDAAEPVSFRFGGTLIPMGGDPQAQQPTGRPLVGSAPPGAGRGGMSSTQSAILGFVAIVVVLGLVFYFVGH